MAALDMALDDVIEKTRPGGRGKGSKGKGKKGGGFMARQRTSYQSSAARDGDNLDRSLDDLVEVRGSRKGKGKGGKSWRSDDDFGGKGKGYGKSKGKGYGKGFGKDSYRTVWDDHDDRDGRVPETFKGGRKGGYSAWSDARHARSDQPWGLGGSDEGRGNTGRLSSKDLFPVTHPERRKASAKVATGSGGFLRIEQGSDDDEPPRRRAGGVSRQMASVRSGAGSKRALARDDDDDDRRPRAKAAKTTRATKVVKVTNIPKELKARDVREAFESETGKIEKCELGKGTAIITFIRAGDAVKAVDAFHKGELNGKIISVVLEN